MKKTTKKTEPKTKTTTTTAKGAPPWQPTKEEVDRATSGLMRLVEQAQHRNALAQRDETIVELADRVAELEEVNDGLREQIRTLGGVIAST